MASPLIAAAVVILPVVITDFVLVAADGPSAEDAIGLNSYPKKMRIFFQAQLALVSSNDCG